MDARGNLINNNMNVRHEPDDHQRRVPALGAVASMGGMSEFTMILDHYSVDWRIGYLLPSQRESSRLVTLPWGVASGSRGCSVGDGVEIDVSPQLREFQGPVNQW